MIDKRQTTRRVRGSSTKSGALPLPEVVGPLYEEINKLYGTDHKPAFK